ncbi:GDSL-type esterase/lipase family protein [Streptomyces orinoci]|uniref:GDSL-type esterase/lipase family protein n=1 Tax=Streptomyces orinoci TaxID=67339 RepID=A0ABV3K0M4_STRON|nr:GDSL-type esterase/lipase family protein [Streptomyces orinoci]
MTEATEANPLLDIPIDLRILRGALDLERTAHGLLPHRLPGWARKQFPDAYLARAESSPSGVRLAVRTRATVLELDVHPTRTVYRGLPIPADGRYDLHLNGRPAGWTSVSEGDVRTMDLTTLAETFRPGPPGTVRFTGLPAEPKDLELWLPQNEVVELLALRTDAPVEPIPDRGRKVWLHHGSSISHGTSADSPSTSWPALAAAQAGVELLNLGLSGNALLDPFLARVIRDTPADLISVKLGINLVNSDLLRLRAFAPAVHGFLDTIREGHPHTPLLLISPLLCPIQEDTPGPIVLDLASPNACFRALGDPTDPTRLTLRTIRAELSRLADQRAADDPHLHYLDGLSLYGERDFAELPLPDALHPDGAGHRRIAERFAESVFGEGGPFAG